MGRTRAPANSVCSIDELTGELDRLRAYGVKVPDSAYAYARQADLRLFCALEPREAALLVLRRAESRPSAGGLRRAWF